MRDAIIEIIQKECELYRLKEFGLLVSVEEEADRLLPFLQGRGEDPFSDNTVFRMWKEEMIGLFYSRLRYVEFLKTHKGEPTFSHFLLSLRKRLVGRMQKAWVGDTIDSVLSVPSHTLAFKMTVMLSEEADRQLLPFIESYNSPNELEEACGCFCENYYPVDLDKLLRSLLKNDKEFWEDIYLLIKRIAIRVTSYLLLSNQYKEEIVQDTWSESSLLFRDKVLSDAIPVFGCAAHLYNYLARICQNKCHEVIRRSRQQELSMNNPDLELLQSEIINDPDMIEPDKEADWLSDIDIACDYEVSTALTIVLWDKMEPWYTKLVEGIEDKVTTLLQHYVQGLSYEKITFLHVPDCREEERQRLQTRLRQDVVRVRKELKMRFVRILMNL